ncbi:unnamed protein product [Calypogeia fissa]
MRRIFPLKSVSSGAGSNKDVHHNHGGAGAAPAQGHQKDSNSRPKGTIVSSRYAPDLSKKSPASRSSKSDASSSGELTLHGRTGGGNSTGNGKREHWCPACPSAAENGVRCDTPPSGDENTESKEVEKSVISCPSEDQPNRARSRHPSVDADHSTSMETASRGEKLGRREKLDIAVGFDSVVADVMKGSARVPSANKYSSSKRGGLGAVDNLVQERHKSKPPFKAKTVIIERTTSLPDQDTTTRSTSVPKARQADSRSISNAQSEPQAPRMQSMRILKVPERVFEASSLSSTDSTRVSDASSSNESPTPRSRTASPRSKGGVSHERDRLQHPPPVRTTHSRAQSYTEGLGNNSSKPSVNSPSHARKPPGSPRATIPRKELGAIPITSAAEVISKAQQGNKYSGARVVAERLAKAFRGSSKIKDGKPMSLDSGVSGLAERRTKLGQSKRMTVKQEIADSSYDGSCSDTSSLQTGDEGAFLTNVLQLGRPGDLPSHHSRKDSAGSTTAESALSWQDVGTDGRVLPSQRPLNDHPTPERESSSPTRQDSSQLLKNSIATATNTGSRRWNSSANDGNKSPSQRFLNSPSRQEKEKEILKGWLEGLKRQSEGTTDDLEMKSRMAEQRISALSGEQSFESNDILHDLRALDEDGNSNLAAGINIMQQRIKRMHEEKKRLALEVASEVKRRITERAAAKEVLVMMKREMEACVRVMEKEKLGIQAGFERELERRDSEWQKKVEDMMLEEKWLRERVRRLEDEKGGLQSELTSVASREDSLRDKVREFESQMEGHRKRVEGAERTILDLRQSLVSSCQQARQAENELENVRKVYLEKESQGQELAREVGRLQQLCADHENSIKGLQQGLMDGVKCSSESNEETSDSIRKELVRLSTVEKSLREELEVLRSDTISLQNVNSGLLERLGNVELNTEAGGTDQTLQAALSSLQSRTIELQEENEALSSKLQNAEKERDSEREALRSLESNLSGVEGDSKALQDEVGQERSKVQDKEREIHRLERRVDGLLKNNQMLQGILAMREKAALISDEEAKEKEKAVKEARQLEAEMRDSLQVSARQLAFMNERAELMSEKLKERDVQLMALKSESGKKDDVIRGLEQSLSDLARSMDAQNRRIMQLSSKNGELSRHLQARGKEVDGLHPKSVEDSHGRIASNQEVDEISSQAHDVKQELEAQNLLCKLLRDKLSQSEDDLNKRCEEVAGLIRSRDWFQSELQRAQSALGEASQRLATLERTVKQKEDIILSWKAEKQGYLQDILKLREALPQVEHERDEMREEADEIGREALRLSAEVEVLRRKVVQLEEDVLVKEGQISILRGSCFGASE